MFEVRCIITVPHDVNERQGSVLVGKTVFCFCFSFFFIRFGVVKAGRKVRNRKSGPRWISYWGNMYVDSTPKSVQGILLASEFLRNSLCISVCLLYVVLAFLIGVLHGKAEGRELSRETVKQLLVGGWV